jgi:8-oxo-dGTP diphosphatase
VDLGESVEDAAKREVMEEMAIEIELTGLVGVYSRAEDRTVVVVYAAIARGIPSRTEEALEVRAFAPVDIPWQTLAFWSDERALRDHLSRRAGAGAPS